ncbi:MAG: Na+/H+ antiporter [Candidatus Melainabacteria bacterium]
MHETAVTHQPLDIETVVSLLLVAVVVAVGVKRIRIPYTVALVVVGLLLSFFHAFEPVLLTEQLVLFTFLPALLFEAAWNLDIRHLRASVKHIISFATLGVVLSILIIGALLHAVMGIPWLVALLFGAIVAPTDPVSVVAVMKTLHLDHRLASLVEGESLMNDGTAVVLFKLILAMIVAFGMTVPHGLLGTYLMSGFVQFLMVVVGGVVLGGVIGLAFSVITRYFDDHMLELTFTTIMAYGTFLLAESIPVPGQIPHLHVSGVIATVASGLVMGNYGRQTGMSASTKIVIASFWEYAGFVMNSLLFLMVGLEIQVDRLLVYWKPIAVAILGVLLARTVAVYGLSALGRVFKLGALPAVWQHVLVFSGLRGALSMALVLSIPRDLLSAETRELLILMVFGVVLFTLVVQGVSIARLLQWLGLGQPLSPELKQYQLLRARLKAAHAASHKLNELVSANEVLPGVAGELRDELTAEMTALDAEMNAIHLTSDQLVLDDRLETRTQLLRHRKSVIADLRQQGALSDEAAGQLRARYDAMLDELQSNPSP